MISLFTQQVQILKKKPQLLSKATYNHLKAAAFAHHPHNKLIPASDIQQLLTLFTQYSLTSNNVDAVHNLLASNCLVMILKVNFNQLNQNKLYGTVVMQYGQILEQLIKEIRKPQQHSFGYTKLIARGIVLSKIILKLVQRTHAFVPEYYRFVRQAIIIIEKLLQQQDLDQQPLTQKQNTETLIIRMCLSKKVTKQYIIHILNCIHQQINQNKVSCPSSKDITIIQEVKQKFETISSSLPEELGSLINSFAEKQEENDGNVYLEEPVAVKQLTPRIYDEEKSAMLSKLRRKKQKLSKKIQNDLRKNVALKQQENHAREDVRRQRSKRQYKKQLFVVQKQTADAKKYHKKEQKVKMIKKTMNSKVSQKSKLDKLSAKKKKK